MILILCKYPKRTYIYAHTTTILSVPFKIIFENKSDSSQRRFAKKDEGNEWNSTLLHCNVSFQIKIQKIAFVHMKIKV